MDAPTYPPATAYSQPRRLARLFTTKDTPAAILQANPAAWAIVQKHIPGIERRVGNPMLKPHLSNFSLLVMVGFGIIPADVLPAIDKDLATLGTFS